MLIDKVKEALRLVAADINKLQVSDVELIAQMEALNQAFTTLTVSAGVISIKNEGSVIAPAVRTINFAGDAIDAVNENGEVTVTVNKPTRYVHTQYEPAEEWIIDHNLNTNPNIVVMDSSGSIVQGEYKYVDPNQVSAKFVGGFSGKAYLS